MVRLDPLTHLACHAVPQANPGPGGFCCLDKDATLRAVLTECPTSGGHWSWRCCPLRQALGRPPIGLIWGASPISSSTIRLMRRALFATGLLLVAILTACSQDGCAAPRAELKILMQAWEDKIVGGDMPGAIIAQAKVEDLMRGDYWVCFQS